MTGAAGLARPWSAPVKPAALLPVVAMAVTAVGFTLLSLAATARMTVLNASFDQGAVDRQHVAERLYTDVLPTPEVREFLTDALAPAPGDPGLLIANARLLLPPGTLRASFHKLIREFVDYLVKGADTVDLTRAMQPFVAHVVGLSEDLVPGTVLAAPSVNVPSVRAFERGVRHVLTALREGAVPTAIPQLPLTRTVAAAVTDAITRPLPQSQRALLRPQLTLLLSAGRSTEAVAVIASSYFAAYPRIDDRVGRSLVSTTRALRDPVRRFHDDAAVRTLRLAHHVIPVGLWSMVIVAVVSALGGLGWTVHLARRRDRRIVSTLAATLAVAAAVSVSAGMAALSIMPDPLRLLASDANLPAALRVLVADVDDDLRSHVVESFLRVCAAIAVGAIVALLVDSVTSTDKRRRLIARLGLVALLGTSGLALGIPVLSGAGQGVTCNSAEALCSKRYDEVTYLAAHNAMASSDAGFVNAAQGPDIPSQLDDGVRALLLDLHYWTMPTRVQRYLARLSPSARATIHPLLSKMSSRPGVWLCHVACQLGAIPAEQGFRQIRTWMQGHQDAVVTLMIEDHTSPQDTEAALKQAGLDDLAWRPPAGPNEQWPTLGQMVRSGRRLVVFTERANWRGGWLANFHSVGAETAYRARTAAALSCRPGRGVASANLFLLNNWVSSTVPSRANALAVNNPRALLRRVAECRRERSMIPNFIAVDFAQVGDPLRAVDVLNRTGREREFSRREPPAARFPGPLSTCAPVPRQPPYASTRARPRGCA